MQKRQWTNHRGCTECGLRSATPPSPPEPKRVATGLSCEQGPPPKRIRSKEPHEEEDAVGFGSSGALAAARRPRPAPEAAPEEDEALRQAIEMSLREAQREARSRTSPPPAAGRTGLARGSVVLHNFGGEWWPGRLTATYSDGRGRVDYFDVTPSFDYVRMGELRAFSHTAPIGKIKYQSKQARQLAHAMMLAQEHLELKGTIPKAW